MDIRQKMNQGFCNVTGGLFAAVDKADVGDAVAKMEERGVALLSWADPFKPDCMIPQCVRDAMVEYIDNGMAEHYTVPIGNFELKDEIAKKLARDNGLTVNAQRNIIITPGSDSGLLFAMMPFVAPGDEILIPDPSYPSNFVNASLLQGVGISVPLDEKNGYKLDIAAFEERVTDRTKMVVLTNPNNPTSTVFSREELTALADFVIKHDLVLVVDQAFEDSVYDGKEMVTMAALPGMWERTVTVFSISKGMGLSGLRVGYVVADDHVMDVMFGSAVNIIGATNTASQHGAIAAFKNPGFVAEYTAIFEKRRHYVCEKFNSVPGVSMQLPQSAFLAWVNISALGTAEEIAKLLLDEANVSVNSGNSYGELGAGHLRIVFGCYRDDAVLYAAVDRMCDVLAKRASELGLA